MAKAIEARICEQSLAKTAAPQESEDLAEADTL